MGKTKKQDENSACAIKVRTAQGWVGLDWVGLSWDGMGWVGMGWAGMGCFVVLRCVELSVFALRRVVPHHAESAFRNLLMLCYVSAFVNEKVNVNVKVNVNSNGLIFLSPPSLPLGVRLKKE